jgi:hypothetical protein
MSSLRPNTSKHHCRIGHRWRALGDETLLRCVDCPCIRDAESRRSVGICYWDDEQNYGPKRPPCRATDVPGYYETT